MNLNPPSEHQLLVFWVALLVIFVTAKLFGMAMKRIGQPAVVGELAAGLVLGPSILGRISPDITGWLFPDDDAQTAMLFTVGWIGVLLLLVATGFETDLGLIRRLGSAATAVSAGSLLVPMAAGLAVGWFIPAAFLGDDTSRLVFALFIATALSISSLPVIAKILGEMGLMRRNFGQLTLAAGMANDVIGWIALGFIAGLAQAGGVKFDKLAITLVGLTAFFVFAFTIGQRLVDRGLRNVRAGGDNPVAATGVILLTALSFGVVTQWLHVEAVLGAFVAGVIVARSRFADHKLVEPIETMTTAIFAPVFFATAGLRVDLGLLFDVETLVWGVIVLAAASLSKFIGSLIGASAVGLSGREGAALGVGLNARGALEIVIATVGLSLGVLNDRSYTVIVLMAMATSMFAPPMLRKVLAGWEGSTEERKRLETEKQLDANIVVRGGAVLLPTRGGLSSLLAAQVVDLAWPESTEITLFTVGESSGVDVQAFRNVFHGRTVRHEFVTGDVGFVDAVVAEAKLGYDAIVVGSSTAVTPEHLLSPAVDGIMMASPIPTVVVRRPKNLDQLPWAFGRAIVPISGRASARAAQEIAGYLSSSIGTDLQQVHVAPPVSAAGALLPRESARTREVVQRAETLATVLGANSSTWVAHHENTATAIMDAATELRADMVVTAGTVRRIGDHPYLGDTVQDLIKATTTSLIIAATPDPHGAEPIEMTEVAH
jgi:Kef-type K+ transport system membrane component KefB